MPHLADALTVAPHPLGWDQESPPVAPFARPALLAAAVHLAELTVPDLRAAAVGGIGRDCALEAVEAAEASLLVARAALV